MPPGLRLVALLLASAAIALPGAVTLRYAFRPGQVLRYTVKDTLTVAAQTGAAEPVVLQSQKSTATLEMKVTSAAAGQGTVEQTYVRGSQQITTPDGTTSQVMSPNKRVFTLSTTGKLLKLEHRLPNGQTDPQPQPMDGLNFSVPEKPVKPGESWNETLSVVNLDGRPVSVRATSTYTGSSAYAGHPCAKVGVSFSGAFQVPETPTSPAGTGSMRGKVTYYLASDLGREAGGAGDVTITARTGTGASAVTRTLTFHTQQTLEQVVQPPAGK